MARSSSLLSLLVVILALISLVQASFSFNSGLEGPRRVHNKIGFLSALDKSVDAPLRILPNENQGQVWIFVNRYDDIYHIIQIESHLFLSPPNPENPSPFSPLVLSPRPQEWKLVEVEEGSGRFSIELPEPVNGKVLVLDLSPIRVFPPFAGLAPKEDDPRQLWELEERNAQRFRHRLNRLECQ
ncbi:hypothetical protein BGX26_012096 [Mortierella sp. AD094]|nr:hypothetical protein BGX26_012096 [Mortierella sp. AD094]